MTGYGRAVSERDGRQIAIELKSVNHRFLDLNFKLPRALLFLEDELRREISSEVARGHIEVYANYRNTRRDARTVEVDLGLAEAYLAALDSLQKLGLKDDRTVLSVAKLPDVLLTTDAADDPEELKSLAKEALRGALSQLKEMRRTEGENLFRDLSEKTDAIERLTGNIEARYPETVDEYRARLNRAVSEISEKDLDPARMSLEIALMIDRSAIAEETVRLRSHVSQMRTILELNEPVGRKLDFLVQELNREANTISSKSQDVPITRLCMELKGEIEKLREQLQNVE